jgi:hypothetical protein
MKTLLKVAAALLGITLLVPAFAMAQTAGVNTTAQAQVTPTSAGLTLRAKVTASSTAETTRAARAKDKAAQEIDRRIASLNKLLARITAMKKVSVELKGTIKTNVENQINGFTALKAKIEADTDLATLKTDIKSITDSYRIYILVMPQVHISAAADRMATIINMMAEVGAKLQARIADAKTKGADTTALEASLTSLGTKLGSAQAHAEASINLIAPLVPDQGDQTIRAKNEAEIKKAQAEIKSGHEDLVAARKDISNIISGLGKINAQGNASTTIKTP